MYVIKIAQFNIGFIRDNPDGSQTSMIVDERNTENLETITLMDFALYLVELKKYMANKMKFVSERRSDIAKLEELNLKTIDVSVYKSSDTVWNDHFKMDIGSLALLTAYDNKLYKEIHAFIEEHDGTTEPLHHTGAEARNGISIFNTYVNIVLDKIIPVFNLVEVNKVMNGLNGGRHYTNYIEWAKTEDTCLTRFVIYGILETYMFDKFMLTYGSMHVANDKEIEWCRRNSIKHAVVYTESYFIDQKSLKELLQR